LRISLVKGEDCYRPPGVDAPPRAHRNGPERPGSWNPLATLFPLLRKAVLIVILGSAVLISLSSLGIDIAPLLAGAGVIGVAIGFGTQTLVRDIISGIFIYWGTPFGSVSTLNSGRSGALWRVSLCAFCGFATIAAPSTRSHLVRSAG
jgi:hypothetical protein